MKQVIATVAFAMVGVGCSASSASTTIASSPSTSVAPTSVATTSPDTARIDSPCLIGDVPFRDVGLLGTAGDDGGDARQVAALRWAAYDGCERFVVDLVSADGAPATSSGPVSAEMLSSGVVRITLPPVIALTAVADAAFEGALADRAFVVRDFPGTLLVDLHVNPSPEARITALDSPARVVIDLRPGSGAEATPTPVIGENVIVFEPSSGDAAYPIRVSGYARTFEATVVARLLALDELAFETFTTATDYLDAWGRFTMEIPTGPSGRVDLFVGEDSAATGDPRGVTVELSMG